MMDVATILIAGLVVIIVFLWFQRANPNLPPSPMRPLPIVGHLLYMPRDTRTLFKKWRQICGDIYSFYLGRSLVIVLSGYDLIKEALVKNADAFSDRPQFFVDEVTGLPGIGLLFSSGHVWKEQRYVAVSILRAFGMGKNLLAIKIEEEIIHYIEYLRSLKGKPTNIRIQTNISSSNIICSILIGHRFEYDDQEFQDLMSRLESVASDQQNVSLINFFSWLKYLPGDLFLAKRMASNAHAILNMLKKFIQEKKRDLDETSDPCNMIDAFYIERNKKIESGISTTMDENSLLKVMNDLFEAGTETVSTTIIWCVLYLINNPEVQDKAYQEIKEKVGIERAVTIQDKSQLTYLNAVIMETQRLASIVPMSLPHMCSEEVTLSGYTIPKGAHILPNLDSVLHDTTIWGDDAMSFRPERFIDENDKLKTREEFIPFSIGRRVCLGEAIARMQLFLFLSSMIQKFQFLPANPGSFPPLDYKSGIVNQSKPYTVRAVERA